MGRQSSRLYFQEKDHKDIYFQGHYHDAMYITDSEGKATLVWEKLKGELIPYISMVSYVGGKYYLVAESTKWTTDLGHPILYEGVSFSNMKKRGLIFGDNAVRGRYYVMHAYSDRLVIIRMRNKSEIYTAVIPIIDNTADMDNISYELNTYEHSGYTPYQSSEYVYRKGNCYYCSYDSGSWRLYKNNIKLPCDTYLRDICINNDRLIAVGGLVRYGAGSGIPALQFGILDDKTDTVELKEVSLEPVAVHLQNSEREGAIEFFKGAYNDYQYVSDSIESIETSCDEGEKFNNYFRSSDNRWYKTVSISLKVKFKGTYRAGTYYLSTTNDANYSAIYRVAINFDDLSLSYIRVNNDNRTYILSQLMSPEMHVQTVMVGGRTANINWGKLNEDYIKDNVVTGYRGDYTIPNISDITIASISARGNELIVGINSSLIDLGNFFVIDMDSGAAFYKTLEAYEE